MWSKSMLTLVEFLTSSSTTDNPRRAEKGMGWTEGRKEGNDEKG